MHTCRYEYSMETLRTGCAVQSPVQMLQLGERREGVRDDTVHDMHRNQSKRKEWEEGGDT